MSTVAPEPESPTEGLPRRAFLASAGTVVLGFLLSPGIDRAYAADLVTGPAARAAALRAVSEAVPEVSGPLATSGADRLEELYASLSPDLKQDVNAAFERVATGVDGTTFLQMNRPTRLRYIAGLQASPDPIVQTRVDHFLSAVIGATFGLDSLVPTPPLNLGVLS